MKIEDRKEKADIEKRKQDDFDNIEEKEKMIKAQLKKNRITKTTPMKDNILEQMSNMNSKSAKKYELTHSLDQSSS